MARVKLSEYSAKKLIIGQAYTGIAVRAGALTKIPKGQYVAKVDQGIKKRFKQGLVAVDQSAAALPKFFKQWEKKGFSQFIVEPYFQHEATEEQYFSLERIRDGIRLLHARGGGIDIEEHMERVISLLLTTKADCESAAKKTGIPQVFLSHLYDVFQENFFAFVEINPLVVRDDKVFLLDAAVLVDSTASFFVKGGWTEDGIVKTNATHPAEKAVEALAATTPAALSLKMLNPNGALFFLLSGGGGSIVIADEAATRCAGTMLANYGEYSGGPTREETYLYSREVIGALLASKAPRKALVIAGGVANFTDVKKTFAGIIDALSQKASKLRKQGIKVFVRRGGPNEITGLSLMRSFLEKEGLLGAVYGSDTIITQAVEDAIESVKK
jgi:ATP-citrate lyase beta-subunit